MSLRLSAEPPFVHSISTSPSANYSVISSIIEEDAYATKLPETLPYVEEIANFKAVKRDEHFDIHPSWSGMNIHSTTMDQLDMQILSQRVNRLLEYSIYNTQIIGALPKLLDNDALLLRKWMKPEDAEFVGRRLNRANSKTLADSTKHIRTVTGYKIATDLQHAFRLLTTNKCFGMYIEKYPPQMSQYIKVFTNALTEFNQLVKRQMEMTAKELAQKDSRLRLLYEVMRERRVEMKRYTDTMGENFAEHDAKMKKKDVQIARVTEKFRQARHYYSDLMLNCLRASDKILFQSGEQSLLLQSELSELAKSAQITYALLRDDHLTEERMLRTRKIKYEAQLAMWLSKYDSDVGDRQAELDAATELYEKETEEMQELECLLMEQDQIFARYKTEEERNAMGGVLDALYKIASNRAAKIIQKAWRAYINNRKKKRKVSMKKRQSVKISTKK